MEQFLILAVILVISAISNWLQKKRQAAEEQGEWTEVEPPPVIRPNRPPGSPTERPDTPRPQPPPLSEWERELRKLLGEEVPPPAPPPAAPPPVIQREPRPAPSAPPPPKTPAPKPSAVPREAARTAPSPGQGLVGAKLKQSSEAYQRALQLHEDAAQRLRQASEGPKRAAAPPTRRDVGTAAPLRQAVAMVRRPETVRQAFVASVVLGPPKALEPTQGGSN